MLGALSKSLATIVTQPLIVAKVGLQSKPPKAREGRPFKGFVDVMRFIVEQEGPLGLFKGIGPQILKGLLVQGILMMIKDRYVLITPGLDWTRTVSQLTRIQDGVALCTNLVEIKNDARKVVSGVDHQDGSFRGQEISADKVGWLGSISDQRAQG